MRDFIFITGASGVGKTTLAKALFDRIGGAYLETSMVPEFRIPDDADPGAFEEKVCFEATVAQMIKFHELGIRNIIAADFDDLRTADLPILFKGYDFVTLKLVCSDYEQNRAQMADRGNGLIDFELLERMYAKVMNRPLLVNEVLIDVAGKLPEEVLAEALARIGDTPSKLDYDYKKPPKDMFYSWVFSNGLR